MSKVEKDLKSIKFWVIVYCCVALPLKWMTPDIYGFVVCACIASRTLNEKKFEFGKDSA